ncbi:MAG: Tm-1-like ATP-binding domain-containing protein, partial [Burkholderiales bacterium]|nr:Tm-1-like ATP-binding domain-containing protein [Burkholderiales bacterium]
QRSTAAAGSTGTIPNDGTLMRTNAEENVRIGRFIAAKLNRMTGPVRFLIPEGGLSGLDVPGGPFWDPAADKALFDTLATEFRPASNRRLLRLPHHINDRAFAEALAANFREIAMPETGGRAWPAFRASAS